MCLCLWRLKNEKDASAHAIAALALDPELKYLINTLQMLKNQPAAAAFLVARAEATSPSEAQRLGVRRLIRAKFPHLLDSHVDFKNGAQAIFALCDGVGRARQHDDGTADWEEATWLLNERRFSEALGCYTHLLHRALSNDLVERLAGQAQEVGLVGRTLRVAAVMVLNPTRGKTLAATLTATLAATKVISSIVVCGVLSCECV
jgi:hypothetical protein